MMSHLPSQRASVQCMKKKKKKRPSSPTNLKRLFRYYYARPPKGARVAIITCVS